MITRLHVRNYHSIADVTLELGATNLLLGLNGAGKTSIFDVLAALRDLVVEGERCDSDDDPVVFPLRTLPRWLKEDRPNVFEQVFALNFEGSEGPVRYELVVEQNEKLGKSRVSSERLFSAEQPVFEFQEGSVQLYRRGGGKGPTYTFDWTRSAIGTLMNPEIPAVNWFKERMRNIACLRIDAPRMDARTEKEAESCERDFSNFPSWYRRAVVSNTAAAADYLVAIRSVIGGMESLDLRDLGQGIMVLRAAFSSQKEASSSRRRRHGSFWLDFNELSDGQRALVGLYALLHFLVREEVTLCIDEPDNFVALAEIQPWLLELGDRVDDLGAQVLLASHHPELLNLLAVDHGILLEREGGGATTARRFPQDSEVSLEPAEVIARGWERE